MYPTFVRFVPDRNTDDPLFAMVAADFGLGNTRPGLALRQHEGHIEVLIAPDGRTALFAPSALLPGLPASAALGLMDALEEAIEDALDLDDVASTTLARLQETLVLLERCMPDA